MNFFRILKRREPVSGGSFSSGKKRGTMKAVCQMTMSLSNLSSLSFKCFIFRYTGKWERDHPFAGPRCTE